MVSTDAKDPKMNAAQLFKLCQDLELVGEKGEHVVALTA